MEKVVKQPKGDFVIGYVDKSEMGNYSGIKPISIDFLPNAVMLPYEALEYANELSEYIVKEAKVILSEEHEFYKDWEIRFSNQFTGSSTDLVSARRIAMNVYCKQIESN